MNTLSLYNIKSEYLELMAAIKEQGGEITPEQEEALAINEGNYVEKAENYGKYILYLQNYQSAADAEIKRIEGMKAEAQKVIDRMKERLAGAIEVYGKDKLKMIPSVKISSRTTTAVDIYAPEQIPEEYFKTVVKETTTISKTAIREAIEAGKEVAGAQIVRNTNITIQ